MAQWTRQRYLSAEAFEDESRNIFERTWMCAAHLSELPKPGSFVRARIGQEDVLIVRNRQGEIRAMLNLCQHRGTVLCKEDQGNFGRSIRCMYHGWTYDLNGKLVGIPLRPQLPEGVEKRHLKTVEVAEWLGYVWVNLTPGVQSFEEYKRIQIDARFGNGFNPLPNYALEGLQVVKSITYEVEANWKLIWENFHECYHCPALHPELSAAVPYMRQGWGTVTNPDTLAQGLGASIAPTIEGVSISGKAAAEPLPTLPENEKRMFYGFYAQPSISASFMPDHVYFMRVLPVSATHTRVIGDWLFHPDAAARPDFEPSDAIKVFDVTNLQDFEACELMQSGAASRHYDDAQLYMPHEYLIAEFRTRVDQALRTGEWMAESR